MLRGSFQAGSQGFVGLGVKAKGHVSDVFNIISLSPKPETPLIAPCLWVHRWKWRGPRSKAPVSSWG